MGPQAPATIVVVDDKEVNRQAIANLLQQAGYIVQPGRTAADALRLAAGNPDLVILNGQLPDQAGSQVCHEIKANPRTASIPVLLTSTPLGLDESRALDRDCGADGFLTWPLEPRELLATVKALVRVRQAELASRVQSEWLRVTVSSIADGVIATDTQNRVTFMNPVAESLTGWPQAEAAGKPLQDVFQVINETTGEMVENSVIRAIRQGGIVSRVNFKTLIARDGSQRPISDSAAPIRDDQGNFLGFVLVIRDVTERRQMENQLRQRAQELAASDQRKDEFLAMLAHELRNPLAPLRNAAHILRFSSGQGQDAELARQIIERQVNTMARLVDDLLDVSRVSRGKIQLRMEVVDLAQVIGRAVETARPVLEERGHHFQQELPAQPVFVQADPLRLEQVLTNLLNNAAKYTDPGGRIRLTAQRQGNEVAIRVRDNGIGIGAAMLPHIFELFTQADRALDRAQGGLGIGLTLVRNLVEMHGGKVSAASAGLGQGSEFMVRLPVLVEAEAQVLPPATNGQSRQPARRFRILVVDDNSDTSVTLAMLLKMEGQDVQVAHYGSEALALAETFQPEIVLLDIGLPGMDGFEVASRLRQQEGGSKRTLAALTGYGQEEDRRRSRAAGFDYHFVKPVDLKVLQELLLRLEHEQRPTAEPIHPCGAGL